jgi:hypothetical protein
MSVCVACGKPISLDGTQPVLRSADAIYHLTCAPGELLESAGDEYQAILKKGVRYFVEKYSGPAEPPLDPGARFLNLGRAVEAERERRMRNSAHTLAGAK